MSSTLTGERISRREFFTRTGAAGLAAGTAFSLGHQHAFANSTRDDTIVFTFLRGGADGLDLLIPRDDPDYVTARPTLKRTSGLVDVGDPRFGLHPDLAALGPLAGAYIPAFGSPHPTRSHFSAMDFLDRGKFTHGGAPGWVARCGNARTGNTSVFKTVTFGGATAGAAVGASNSVTVPTLSGLGLPYGSDPSNRAATSVLLEDFTDMYTNNARAYLDAIETGNQITASVPSTVTFPTHPYGTGLAEASKLIRADIGARMICVDLGGWDTHDNQASELGPLRQAFAGSVAAFFDDLGSHTGSTTLVVLTEFGRRVDENASKGTDHGRGSIAMAFGNVNPGVHGNWAGLAPAVRDGGAVPVLNDWRDVLAQLVDQRTPADPNTVFPDRPGTFGGTVFT